jgi:hypothetical protein
MAQGFRPWPQTIHAYTAAGFLPLMLPFYSFFAICHFLFVTSDAITHINFPYECYDRVSLVHRFSNGVLSRYFTHRVMGIQVFMIFFSF